MISKRSVSITFQTIYAFVEQSMRLGNASLWAYPDPAMKMVVDLNGDDLV
jgi:hypothetical protein